ncbi:MULTISPECIES: extensin family protein [unclassified Mesorhizobium]|uniref:extensin-like domain-containing protein n=1 Tax=unclassified Mesorhizobium TaxID=325217 RepID=UPI0033393DAC
MAAFGFFRLGRLLLAVAATPLAGPVLAKAPDLPQTAPVPQLNQQVTPPPPTEIPVPEPRPEDAPEPPAIAPQPPEKPARAEPPASPPGAPPNPAEADEKAEQKILPDPRSVAIAGKEMPPEELACRRRLKSMGVDFEERKPEHDTAVGCSIPYPIVLKTLGKSIAIGPDPELNCQMAEAAARFAASVIQPAAKAEFGMDVKSIGQASAFVCRPRHAGGKLSEHAFGNALDIASFTLSDGKEIDVGPAPPEKDAKFLDIVRKAACGPFKTVLGPGSDADHSLHLHFDLEPRRNGGTFCQ